jgi:hypothetical protein
LEGAKRYVWEEGHEQETRKGREELDRVLSGKKSRSREISKEDMYGTVNHEVTRKRYEIIEKNPETQL